MTSDEVLAWLATVFEETPESIRPGTRRDEIAGWDSLGLLTLMADMDEKFDIRLNERDISALTSVQDILDLLVRHGRLVP